MEYETEVRVSSLHPPDDAVGRESIWEMSVFHSGDIDMGRVIEWAFIGCALGLVVGLLIAGSILHPLSGSNLVAPLIACMTPFTIVGAVVGGTRAILARIDRMSPETSNQKAAQLLRQKKQLPNVIPLPTEEEAE